MRGARTVILSGILLLACSPVSAVETPTGDAAGKDNSPGFNLWVNPGFFTYHFDREAGFRGLNWGLGAQSDLSRELSLLGGSYINSDDARSKYAGVSWQPLAWDHLRAGLLAGAVNGYPGVRGGGWFPAALPWVTVRNEWIGLSISYFPNYPHGLHRAVVTQLMLRIW